MPGVTSERWDLATAGCTLQVSSARSCRTWAKGGPIKEDSVS